MTMYIVLKEYLTHLSTIESKRPVSERKPVPIMQELADSLKVHRTILSRFINNKAANLNLKIADGVLKEMRRRGFPMEVTDLLRYVPDETDRQD